MNAILYTRGMAATRAQGVQRNNCNGQRTIYIDRYDHSNSVNMSVRVVCVGNDH